MKKKLLKTILLLTFLFFSGIAYSQVKNIKGKVTDSAGTPLSGVTVTIKNSSGGTISGVNGTFQLSVKENAVLVFSAVGYKAKEVKVAGNDNITVLLSPDNAQLKEVVVTALGISRTKNSLPYATQQITGSEVTKTLSTNFVNNLSGKVSGLQVTSSNTMGGSNNVILRGMKSLTQSNQALFVVDGVPFDNSNQSTGGFDLGNGAADINPNDIESISVLKGASASALYGSRGANGVILITTKKGSNRKDRGVGVTVDFGVTTGTPDKSTLPAYQLQYGQGYGSAASGTTGNPDPYFYYQPTFNSNGKPVQIVQTDIDQNTGPAYNPNLMVYNWDAFSPGNPNYGKATPWEPAKNYYLTNFFVTPVTTSSSAYLDGGGDMGTFKLGLTHSDDKGYMPNSDQQKDLVNFGGTYKITNKVTAGANINYSHVIATGRDGFGYSSTGVNPMTDFRQFWETNVDLDELKSDYFRSQTNATWNWLGGYLTNTDGNIVKPAYHDNPYWVRYQNYENDSRDRYFGNVNLNYKINNDFNFMVRASRDSYNEMIETRVAVGSSATSSYSRTNSSFAETNYDALLNFDKNLTDKINLKALLGANIRKDLTTSIYDVTNGGLVVPGFYALSNSVNTPNAPTESYSPKEVDGAFAGATISYMDMITLDGTIRRDKSSTLPKDNNSYYYPAISGNFVFSKLLTDLTWLSYGKLRLNYASVGNDAPVFSLQNTYGSSTPFNGQTVFSSPTTNNNSNLKPEINHTYEAGVELSFLKNRIGLDATYYNAKSINQITPITVSSSSGYSTFYVNGGTVQNQGVELTLNFVPIKTTDFRWKMDVNWSKNINKVLSLYNGQPSYTVASYQNSIQLVAEVGKPYGVLRGSDYQYVNGQKEVDANGYYVKSTNKLSDIGNINPDWIGGINNSFTYKSFSLSFLIDIRKGGQVYSLDQDYGASAGLTPATAGYNALGNPVRSPLSQGGGVLFPGVTADGKPNTKYVDASDINTGKYPFSSLFNMAASSYVYDAGYIKLREVALMWSVPKKMLNQASFIKGVDLSLTGKNLWIIHKNLPDSDPEQGVATAGSGGQNGSQGFQSGAYPVYRIYGFNIKLKF